MKAFLGAECNLGWGLINFIQIIAFIPLANFYFPGNVRGFVSFLKIANTAGQGAPNMFYLFIDRDQLDNSPYNYRFDVMGIESTIYIENCGGQLTILFGVLMIVFLLKLVQNLIKKHKVQNKIVLAVVKAAGKVANYNYLIKGLILMYMFFFLSSLLTTVDVNFSNGYEVASFSIGSVSFCFLILFIFSIFTIIQTYYKRIEEDEKFRDKLSCITQDIQFEGKILARFYIPIYLLRRAVFMTIIVVFDNYYLLVAH